MLDLTLAIAHHLLIFAIFGVIAMELMAVRDGMTLASVRRVARVDLYYGSLAAAVLLVGAARAMFAAKGWAYYQHNAFFWAKLGTFALIGLISIAPTLAFLRWRRAGVEPTAQQLRPVRAWLRVEVLLFALLPAFAAAMARGYGEFR